MSQALLTKTKVERLRHKQLQSKEEKLNAIIAACQKEKSLLHAHRPVSEIAAGDLNRHGQDLVKQTDLYAKSAHGHYRLEHKQDLHKQARSKQYDSDTDVAYDDHRADDKRDSHHHHHHQLQKISPQHCKFEGQPNLRHDESRRHTVKHYNYNGHGATHNTYHGQVVNNYFEVHQCSCTRKK